ncbi:MAG: rRNA maturation RNase YbeY [Coriobacteriales bacterium]|jgi:probable rRNA maturation factor|nr:rRNA maturation RNase YbeY [Coriobacteriales bacterium]
MIDVIIDNRSGQELPLEHIAKLANVVLERELSERGKGGGDIELSLSFVDIDEITHLNSVYRDRAEPTDILSFELDDLWTGSATAVEGRVLLGDIVIQPDIARTRAATEGVSLEQELWILVIHGILHLLGYDHATEEDAGRMEAREDEHFLYWERAYGTR